MDDWTDEMTGKRTARSPDGRAVGLRDGPIGRTKGRVNGRMAGRADRLRDGRRNGLNYRTDGLTDCRPNERMDLEMDGRTDGLTDGRIYGGTGGWTERLHVITEISQPPNCVNGSANRRAGGRTG